LSARATSFGYESLSKYLIERGLKEGEMIVSTDRERIERLLFEARRAWRQHQPDRRREMHRGYSEYSQAYLDQAMQQVERVVKEIAEGVGA
jgi:hypothetical protein